MASAATATSTSATQRAASTSGAAASPHVRLAYSRDHDLYLRDEGGATTRLTSDGMSVDPWWTNDRQSLFFTKTPKEQPAQTWRWQPGTGAQQVRRGLWSPDGASLAWEQPLAPDQPSTSGVWVEQGGKTQRTAAPEAGFGWSALAWSPDSRRLVLARFPELQKASGTLGPPYYGPATLWLASSPFSSAGDKLPPLTDGQGHPGWPDAAFWSPDGAYIAVAVGPDQACQSCRADGAPFRAYPVGGGAPIPLGSALQKGALAWAPNGDWLVLSAPAGRETYAKKRLTRYDVAKGTHADLTGDAAWSEVNPAVSPDGTQVAFARGHSQRSGESTISAIISRTLWSIRADGSGPKQLTNAPGWTDEYPVWTPDGQWLIFVRWRPQTSKIVPVAGLWAVRPDGTEAHQLVDAIGTTADYAGGFGFYGQFHWVASVALAPALRTPAGAGTP